MWIEWRIRRGNVEATGQSLISRLLRTAVGRTPNRPGPLPSETGVCLQANPVSHLHTTITTLTIPMELDYYIQIHHFICIYITYYVHNNHGIGLFRSIFTVWSESFFLRIGLLAGKRRSSLNVPHFSLPFSCRGIFPHSCTQPRKIKS